MFILFSLGKFWEHRSKQAVVALSAIKFSDVVEHLSCRAFFIYALQVPAIFGGALRGEVSHPQKFLSFPFLRCKAVGRILWGRLNRRSWVEPSN